MKRILPVLMLSCLAGPAPLLWAQEAAPAAGDAQAAPAVDPRIAEFEAACQALQQNPGASSEEQVLKLLATAGELGRPYTAHLALRTYLTRNASPSPALMLAAARNASAAGDYRTAVSRYKTYLKSAPPGPVASNAAADMYILTLDVLNNGDDAYEFMARSGGDLRQSVAARKFDAWFLWAAQQRRDFPALATRLAQVMSDGMPVEQERLIAWEYLDWLMPELSRCKPEQFAAVLPAKKIVTLIRDNPQRTARYGFIVTHLEYRANAAGKEQAQLDQDVQPVLASARAYFDAVPTAGTLNDILTVFLGGYWERHTASYDTAAKPIREFWVQSFARLPDDEKRIAVNQNGWWNYQAAPEQWIELGAQFPEIFKGSYGTRTLPFLLNQPDVNLYKKQAAFQAGVPSNAASIVNALATGGDLRAAWEHLYAHEMWYQGPEQLFATANNSVWPIWNSFPKDPNNPLPGDYYDKTLIAFGAERIAKTAAAFDRTGVQNYLQAAWRSSGADGNDKSQFPGHMHLLDWVPWNEKDRRETFTPVYEEFKRWADQVRQQMTGPANALAESNKQVQALTKAVADATAARDAAAEADKPAREQELTAKQNELKAAQDAVAARTAEVAVWEKIAAQITPLEDEFKKAMDVNTPGLGDPAKCPDPLAQRIARCIVAINAKNLDQYLAAAREAYQMVRDPENQKTPFAVWALSWLMSNRPEAFDTIDFQCEVLVDQITLWSADRKYDVLAELLNASIMRGRPNWGWWNIPQADREKALKFNAAIGQGMANQAQAGRINHGLIDWFRVTRRGQGWQEQEINKEHFAKLIDTQVLVGTPWRLGGNSVAASYVWFIRNEVQGLAAQYPPETYFDDLFVEEARKTGYLDWNFIHYTRDEQKKVVNVAAEMLGNMAVLPFGYSAQPAPVINRGEFWQWQARAMGADPAVRDAMLQKIEAAYGTTRFDDYAMGRGAFTVGFDLSKPEGRAAFFQKLGQYMERAKAAPYRLNPPYVGAVNQFPPPSLTEEELNLLVSLFRDSPAPQWSGGWGYEQLAQLLIDQLPKRNRDADLFHAAPFLWKITRESGAQGVARQFAQVAKDAQTAGKNDLAAAISEIGLDLIGTDMPEDARTVLTGARSSALLALGGSVPVPRSDPRWPIFDSQLSFSTGKVQTAWERYISNPTIVPQMYKELDPAYVIWLIQENTKIRAFDRARELSQLMIAWVDSTPGGFDRETQASLLLAYADIAMTRQEYPQARALYDRIASAKEYDGTAGKRQAELKVAEVERITRQYDRATEILERLVRRQDKVMQAEAYYQLAMVKTDQEEYSEAADLLENVFQREPNHVEGRLLEGELKIKIKRFDDARDLAIGQGGEKKTLTPGKPLKVDLDDKNLAVVGKDTNIEVRAWTKSGDEEFFSLFPFGDSKTKFSGSINTELGAANKGDHVLQVLGGDEVSYSYSERFTDRQPGAGEQPPVMTVVTDSELYASSGKILTKEELENRALEAMIREQLRMDEGLDRQLTLSAARREDQIKPGNKINIRVVDPDRAATAGRDKIAVKVSTSSSDSVPAFELEETGEYTGIFEGSLPTSSGQALAYASDSAEGNDPNWVISAKGDTTWQGQPDSVKPKTLSVDLNDNVALGTMSIEARVPGRKLRDFLVQTSINGREFQTLARWTAGKETVFEPWDGSLTMEVARFAGWPRQPVTVEEFDRYFNGGYFAKGSNKLVEKAKAFTNSFDGNLNGRNGALGLDQGVSEWYVARWYGAFHMSRAQVRTFKLDHKGRLNNIAYLLAIDGKIAEPGTDPYQITRNLSKGVHRVDVYLYAHRHAGSQFELLIDSAEPPFMVPVPPEMFDPAKSPEIRRAVAVDPAELKANEDGSKFDVTFAPGTRARVVRLLMGDYETDAPAVNKITLADAEGKKILPLDQDFMQMKLNDQLEIVPGDRVTVSYVDPTFITKTKQTQETFMTATYSNAELSAAFVEFGVDFRGERVAKYIPMRRFKPGDTVKVFIKDPDMDVSEQADVIKFSVKTAEGSPVEIEAIETEEHSGVFLGTVFPVSGAPQRPSEVTVMEADDLTLSYLDTENTDPGIPWERVYVVEQTWASEPELRVYGVTSRPLNADELAAVEAAKVRSRQLEELIPMDREMVAARPTEMPAAGEAATILSEGPLLVELLAPQIAQSPRSKAEIYIQTKAGREKYGKEPQGDFDVNVPGTIRLYRYPGDPHQVPTPPGYRNVLLRGNPYAADELDDGRYTFHVVTEMAEVPEKTLAFEEYNLDLAQEPPILSIRGDDEIYIGFRYTDAAGQERWITQTVKLASDVRFDVMDRRYQTMIDGVHVGENLYFRVIQPVMDKTDDKDALTIDLVTSTGKTRTLTLTETFGHSGVFKGLVKLTYLHDGPPPAAPVADASGQTAEGSQNIVAGEMGSLDVAYGDTVTATYVPAGGEPMVRNVVIFKGGDGDLLPFTKRFNDPEIAVQTQFTIAEAWFELAKRHRDLGQESLARREIAQGKKLLEEAIRDYPNTEARAQADYLLANLSFEFAKDTENQEMQKRHYNEAITRFSDIVASYPDSEYAPKSQYKKALVLEKMGQIDQACEEYVKLSYRYPDNELVAETIARLGQYFLTKGKEFDQKADAQTDPVEREKIKIQGRDMFTTAAQVFGRLSERFPQHGLADKTRVLSAQCYLRAKDLEKAIQVFEVVFGDAKVESELRAESMYWTGDAYMQQNNFKDAYRTFKKLTWDFPESKWAKFARGRLTEERLIAIQDADTDSAE